MRYLLIILLFISCSNKEVKPKKYITLSNKKSKLVPIARETAPTDQNSCHTICQNDVTSVYEFESTPAGEKKCTLKFSYPCHPFGCDQSGYTCRTQCLEVNDCSSGASCHKQSAQCVTISTPVCKDDWTLVAPTGEEESCGGYRCVLHHCISSCQSDKDCSQGFECIKHQCLED